MRKYCTLQTVGYVKIYNICSFTKYFLSVESVASIMVGPGDKKNTQLLFYNLLVH